jgi:acyl carrier protein
MQDNWLATDHWPLATALLQSLLPPLYLPIPCGRVATGCNESGLGGNMDDIETKVIEIVSEQMGVDKSEITRETHFINDLNADSLDTVELVMEFEDEFELSIPDEEAEKIQTVGQAIDYIKEHSGNK